MLGGELLDAYLRHTAYLSVIHADIQMAMNVNLVNHMMFLISFILEFHLNHVNR